MSDKNHKKAHSNHKKAHSNHTKELVQIAIGVATLIGGGTAIYLISGFFPVPGLKYILMAPFISMILTVMQMKVQNPFTLLKFGTVFALVMTLIHLVMGLAILSTTLLTYLTVLLIHENRKRALFGGVFFAGYMGVTALSLSKWLIGGVFDRMSYQTFLFVGAACAVFGVVGALLGMRVLKYMSKRV